MIRFDPAGQVGQDGGAPPRDPASLQPLAAGPESAGGVESQYPGPLALLLAPRVPEVPNPWPTASVAPQACLAVALGEIAWNLWSLFHASAMPSEPSWPSCTRPT